ncbi:orotate phosphoribosyltransferase [bacterium]|nr:orotate phosphoribosyltransferase [bacterium]
MKMRDILRLFKERSAFLEGHFLLSSGLHSREYLQCAKVLQFPEDASLLGKRLAQRFIDDQIDVVIGPALGGVIIAYEVARGLKVRALWTERKDSKMTLRRGFEIREGERILVVEDVITTGGSVLETIEVVESHGADVVGVGTIVDRSAGQVKFDVRMESLLSLDVKTYREEECPLCQDGIPLIKPGSRLTL